jgi:hypothetical protein
MNMQETLMEQFRVVQADRDEYRSQLKKLEFCERTLRTENAELREKLHKFEEGCLEQYNELLSENFKLRRREQELICLLEDNKIKIPPP